MSDIVDVYLYVRGDYLSDELREGMRYSYKKTMREFGTKRVKDGDAGLLPLEADLVEVNEGPRFPITFLHGRLDLEEPRDREKMKVRLDKLTKNLSYEYDTKIFYTLLVLESPLHRGMHGNHVCIPSKVILDYPEEVMVESTLVKENESVLSRQPEGEGMLNRQSWSDFVAPDEWVRSPEMDDVPDGEHGVGGRNLLLTMGLERVGYHGGEIPESVKRVTPGDLNLEPVRSLNSLPNLAMHEMIAVTNVVGRNGRNSYEIGMTLENTSSKAVDVEIPHGLLFEVIDPKAGVQNLAAAMGYKYTIGPGKKLDVICDAYCANHNFSSPSNDPMRPTIFKMQNPGRTQGEVWSTMDRLGYARRR